MKKPTDQRTVYWWTHPRALLRYVLSLDDTPHHVALGVSVGLLVGMTPTPGLQMLLVACAYYAFRRLVPFNLTAGLVMTYVSNPITALPLAWLQYQLGRLFVGGDLSKSDIDTILFAPQDGTWWDTAVSAVTELGAAYLLGSVISAVAGATLAYPAMRYLLHLMWVKRKPDSPISARESGTGSDEDPPLGRSAPTTLRSSRGMTID